MGEPAFLFSGQFPTVRAGGEPMPITSASVMESVREIERLYPELCREVTALPPLVLPTTRDLEQGASPSFRFELPWSLRRK